AISVESALRVELTERYVVVESGELHSTEQGVAHENAESPRVAEHARRWGRRDRVLVMLGRVGELTPLVEQARVDLLHERAEPLLDVAQLVSLGRVGNRLPDGAVRVGEVPQQRALGSTDRIVPDVLVE